MTTTSTSFSTMRRMRTMRRKVVCIMSIFFTWRLYIRIWNSGWFQDFLLFTNLMVSVLFGFFFCSISQTKMNWWSKMRNLTLCKRAYPLEYYLFIYYLNIIFHLKRGANSSDRRSWDLKHVVVLLERKDRERKKETKWRRITPALIPGAG